MLEKLIVQSETFASLREYDKVDANLSVLKRHINSLDKSQLERYLDCTHLLATHYLESKNFPCVDRLYLSMKNTSYAFSVDVKIKLYRKIGYNYLSFGLYHQALDYYCAALWHAEELSLKEDAQDIKSSLNELICCTYYNYLLKIVNNELSLAMDIRIKSISPFLNYCYLSSGWALVHKFYSDISPIIETRYFSWLKGQLHVLRQRSLSDYSKFAETQCFIAQQFFDHQQYKYAVSIYRLIIEQAEDEASTFPTEGLLEKIVEINDSSMLGSEKFSSTPKFSWNTWREDINFSREKYFENIPKNASIFQLQAAFTDQLKKTLVLIIQEVESIISMAPCGYSLIGTGSISRGDMSPYSDIDVALLIEDAEFREHAFFQMLVQLLDLYVSAIGEPNGLVLDRGDIGYLTLPNHDLLDTPQGMVQRFCPSNISRDNIEAYAIHRPTFIFGRDDIFSVYLELLMEKFKDTGEGGKHISQLLAAGYINLHYEEMTLAIRNEECNLKEQYIKPLTFLCSDVALYLDINLVNIQHILETFATKKIFPLYFIGLINESLETLTRIRISHHMQKRWQDENITTEKGTLKKVLNQVIKPTYKALIKATKEFRELHLFDPLIEDFYIYLSDYERDCDCISQTEFFQCIQNVIYSLTKRNADVEEYRNYYKKLPEKFRSYYLDSILNSNLNNTDKNYILSQLRCYPQSDGQRPILNDRMQVWVNALRAIIEKAEQRNQSNVSIELESLTLEEVIKPKVSFIAQIFDKDGNLKSKMLPGAHLVIPVIIDDYQFHVKFYPEFAGIEYAVNRLHELVIGGGVPSVDLAKLRIGDTCCPIQISQTIVGAPLHRIFKNVSSIEDKYLKYDPLLDLDNKNFTQLIFLALLTNPEDGKPDNFIISVRNAGKSDRVTHLVPVDNDHAFVPSVEKEGLMSGFRVRMNVKTTLYCLDNMLHTLNKEAVEEFIELSPDKVLSNWLIDLEAWECKMKRIFTQTEIESLLCRSDRDGRTVLQIALGPGTVNRLYERMHVIKQFLIDNSNATHLQLLLHIDPILGKYYRDEIQKSISPMQRFRNLTSREYQIFQDGSSQTTLTTTHTLRSMLGNLPTIKKPEQLTKFDIQHLLSELCILQEQQGLIKQARTDLLNYNSVLFNSLVIDKFRDQVIEELRFQEMKTQNGNLNVDLQRFIIEAISRRSFKNFKLKNLDAIEDGDLLQILSNSGELKKICLENCNKLTNKSLNNITYMNHLEVVSLVSLLELSGNLNFYPLNFIEINLISLKILVIEKCDKLQSLSISAPNLVRLVIKKCGSFEKLNVNAPNLSSLTISECKLLNQAELANGIKNCKLIRKLVLPECDNLKYREIKQNFPSLALINFETINDTIINMLESIEQNRIEHLDVAGIISNDDEVLAVTIVLKGNNKVKSIDLSNNNLSIEAVGHLAELIKINSSLSVVNLANNNLEDDAISLLADSIKDNKCLENINLNFNNITAVGAIELAYALEDNNTLHTLRLLGNDIRDEGATSFLNLLDKNKKINTISLLRANINNNIINGIKSKLDNNKINQGTGLKIESMDKTGLSPKLSAALLLSQHGINKISYQEREGINEQPIAAKFKNNNIV